MSFVDKNLDALEHEAYQVYEEAISHRAIARLPLPRGLEALTLMGEAFSYVDILVAETGVDERSINAVIASTIRGRVGLAFYASDNILIHEFEKDMDWVEQQSRAVNVNNNRRGQYQGGGRQPASRRGQYQGASYSPVNSGGLGGDEDYVPVRQAARTTQRRQYEESPVKKEDHYQPRADLYDFTTVGISPPEVVEETKSISVIDHTQGYSFDFNNPTDAISLYCDTAIGANKKACVFQDERLLLIPCANAQDPQVIEAVKDIATSETMYDVAKLVKILKANFNGEKFSAWFDSWLTSYLEIVLEVRYGHTELNITSIIEDHQPIYEWLEERGIKDEIDELLMSQVNRVGGAYPLQNIVVEDDDTAKAHKLLAANSLALEEHRYTLTLPWKSSWIRGTKSIWVDGCSNEELYGYLFDVAKRLPKEILSFDLLDSALNRYIVYKTIDDGKVPANYLIYRKHK